MDIGKDYELFLDAITGLMVIDKKGNVVYMNDQCADYIKSDREKCIGKYVTEVFPPSNMQKLLKGQNKFNIDFYFAEGRMSLSCQVQLRKDGEIVDVYKRQSERRNGSGLTEPIPYRRWAKCSLCSS